MRCIAGNLHDIANKYCFRKKLYFDMEVNLHKEYYINNFYRKLINRFKQKPPLPWLAITTSIGTLVIALLVGYIFHATVSRIAKVEDDYRQMMELKKRAEAADVAKSQVHYFLFPMRCILAFYTLMTVILL